MIFTKSYQIARVAPSLRFLKMKKYYEPILSKYENSKTKLSLLYLLEKTTKYLMILVTLFLVASYFGIGW